MITSLYIQNYALIEKVTLNFLSGFTVITGETGSGKSILLGALQLILGERADYSVIRDKEQKTIVEATFKISNFDLIDFFGKNELDFSEDTIIRREISAQGKSRAFINDTPVSLGLLKDLSEKLIHIHSQHHTIELKDPSYQLEILDTLADNLENRRNFKTKLNQLKKNSSQLTELESLKNKKMLDADFIAFQCSELEALQLDKTDYVLLENELKSIENNDDIKIGFGCLIEEFTNEGRETNLLQTLGIIRSKLDKLSGLNLELDQIAQRTKEVYLELLDIGEEAINQLENINSNPIEKEALTRKIDAFYTAMRKHTVSTQSELSAVFEGLKVSVNDIEFIDIQMNELISRLEDDKKSLEKLSKLIHDQRMSVIPTIENKIAELLNEVKLVNSRILFHLSKVDKYNDSGSDELKILFSPNKGMEPTSIDKAASGGELSRLMLVLQYILSTKKQLPTVIFDEIDTGVSGEVAQRIGQMLHKMGGVMQIFAITHLPQVAAQGQNHWKVTKSEEKDQTTTNVIPLNLDERIEEIARLMSGDNINRAALENAKALMN